MPTKTFTDDDQSMIFFIVENVFPLLTKEHTHGKTKWLRGVIRHNHKWNGFFQNSKVKSSDNMEKYHSYLLKIVSNKRKMIQMLNSGKLDDNRKRMSPSLKFIMWRLGYLDPGIDVNDIELIRTVVNRNKMEFSSLYLSKDPNLVCHLYLVLGSFYTYFQNEGVLNTHGMTFYYFVDTAIKFLREANPK